jgi:hypothetical protein
MPKWLQPQEALEAVTATTSKELELESVELFCAL